MKLLFTEIENLCVQKYFAYCESILHLFLLENRYSKIKKVKNVKFN